jgi:hypothetical protein
MSQTVRPILVDVFASNDSPRVALICIRDDFLRGDDGNGNIHCREHTHSPNGMGQVLMCSSELKNRIA